VKPLGPIAHPTKIEQNLVADQYIFDDYLHGKNLKFPRKHLAFPRRVKNKIVRILKGLP
jgi:hypothetical protein